MGWLFGPELRLHPACIKDAQRSGAAAKRGWCHTPKINGMEATPAASSAPRALERRHGKWTQAECDYAMLLIEHFTSGRLPGLLGGESLRTTLSECLACTPMRVTKKLSSTHAIGKCVFKLRGSLTNDERQALDAARRAFWRLSSLEGGRPVNLYLRRRFCPLIG